MVVQDTDVRPVVADKQFKNSDYRMKMICTLFGKQTTTDGGGNSRGQ